jgi:hypothetical protein
LSPNNRAVPRAPDCQRDAVNPASLDSLLIQACQALANSIRLRIGSRRQSNSDNRLSRCFFRARSGNRCDIGFNYDLVRLYLEANHLPIPYIESSEAFVLLPMTKDIAVSLEPPASRVAAVRLS